MKRKSGHIEARLLSAFHPAGGLTQTAHYDRTLLLAKQELGKRTGRPSESFLGSTLIMARTGGGTLFPLQGGLMILFMLVLTRLCGSYPISMSSFHTVLGCMSVLSLLSAVPYLQRAREHRMMELETAACVFPRRLLLARILPALLGELGMLAGILLFAGIRSGFPAEGILLSTLLPCLSVTTVSGMLLIRFHGEHLREISLGVSAAVLSLLLAVKDLISGCAGRFGIPVGFLLCGLLFCVSLVQMRRIAAVCVLQMR